MSRQALFSLTIVLGAITAVTNSVHSETSNGLKGCPLEFAIRQVDDFVRDQIGKYAEKSAPLLEGMVAINSKATKPGISTGDQLSPKDRDRFNQLRHQNIQLDAERMRVSDFQRDVHVIYETYE